MAPKKDFTQVAHAVFQQAVGEAPRPAPLTARQENSRKGGLKGGKKRMEALTDEQRTALALKGVAARRTKAPAGEAGAVLVKK